MKRVFDRVEVDHRALWTRVGSFSGGNQQKIAVAKWLFAESRILLLFDPTRGIDVGTKHELYVLMRAFAEVGRLDPLPFDRDSRAGPSLRPGDRALCRAASSAEICAADLSEQAIMRAALGGDSAGELAA